MKRKALATAVVTGLLMAAAPALMAQPEISEILPPQAHEGCTVTIVGTGFSPILAENLVDFNGTAATVSIAMQTLLIVDVPVGATTGDVSVTVGGALSNGVAFTVLPPGPPQINPLFPLFGPVGMSVQISGQNLGAFWCLGETVQVLFDGVPATWSIPFNSQIYTFVPDVTPGLVDVQVVVNGQVSNTRQFLVTGSMPTPTLTSLSQSSGPARTVITLTGENFIYNNGISFGYPVVYFDGVTRVPVFVDDTTIHLTVPLNLPVGDVQVKVRVYQIPSLNFSESNELTYTVTPFTGNPVIASTQGWPTNSNWGSWYRIDGSGFLGDNGSGGVIWPKVWVNGKRAWRLYTADNFIYVYLFALTPSGGSIQVEVDGVWSNVSPFTLP